MCGIVGIHHREAQRPVNQALLQAMNTALAHRGPDGDGLFVDPGIGLGHRRLAIIDVNTGQQPLFNEDATVVTVFNGEIYNFRELARELGGLGHRFRTHSDTEVIVHAWEQWGPNCVLHLHGMFAFAIWDRTRQRLFLARDRLGIKPLYYATMPATGTLLFASELKALLQNPELPRTPDPQAIEDYFAFGYIPDPRSILQAVRKLPPGHTLTIDRNERQAEPRCYWRPCIEPREPGTEGAVVDDLLQHLDASVTAHQIADVPLGAFLSGGIDSSAVVAAMTRTAAGRVQTCSIGFREPRFDESSHAAQVARHLATHHHQHRVDGADPMLIDHLPGIYDEPFADSSAIPTWRLCALAREHVKVALSGDGGDELFAGYEWYGGHLRNDKLRRLLPGGLRRGLFQPLGRMMPGRYGTAIGKLGLDAVDAFAFSTMTTTRSTRQRLFSADLRRDLQGYDAREVVRQRASSAASSDALALAQHIDLSLYLPGDILTKVDRASMAHGLEVRVPLLDDAFVAWAATLPTALKWHAGRGKHVLRMATRRRVPAQVLDRPKMGFSVPLAAWFRGPLRTHLETLTATTDHPFASFLDGDERRRLVDAHLAGDADHGALLWSLLMFERSLAGILGSTAAGATDPIGPARARAVS